MIINNLIGGLGNQLFQISAGYAHAKKIKTEFAINYNIGLGSGQDTTQIDIKTIYIKIFPAQIGELLFSTIKSLVIHR